MAYAVGGKLLVADFSHNRIMIWNSIPTVSGTAADLVLGQPDLSTCTLGLTASKMEIPSSVWSDGARVMVADSGNNRVLIWNTFPTVNGQAADLVLGQPDMTSKAPATAADGLDNPFSLSVSKGQVFVSDTDNNRVLIWNSFPTVTQQAANRVLGQPDFTTPIPGITANTLNNPQGVARSGWDLLVSDTNNNRVLIYSSK